MEIRIEENTLVMVMVKDKPTWQWGWVLKVLPGEHFSIRTADRDTIVDIVVDKEEIVPVATDCIPLGNPNEAPLKHLPKVLTNIIRMYLDLRNQVEALQSNVNGVLGVGLRRTQERLHKLEMRPH